MDFSAALRALRYAAGSPLAFVAYLFVVASWVVIAVFVNRDQNLLKNLKSLPERDRLAALKVQLGYVPVEGGLSAEQYLRSRLHKYYLVAFIVFCMALLALSAIAFSYRSPVSPTTTNPTPNQTSNQTTTGPNSPNIIGNQNSVYYGVDRPYEGWLVAGNKPTPENRCGFPPGAAAYLGTNVAYLGPKVAHGTQLTVIAVDGIDRFVIETDNRGRLRIALLDVFDADGRLVARIEQNRFTVSSQHTFSLTKPDKSTLRLTDEFGTVLAIEFLNPTSIKLVGDLRYPGYPALGIGDSEVVFANHRSWGDCFSGLGPATVIELYDGNQIGWAVLKRIFEK